MDEKLKIGITGHTRGIGKAIFNKFLRHNHTVIGFSKSNGYDISDTLIQTKILSECKNFDIFINNAYYPTAQLKLLSSFIEEWKNTNKLIVNISSKLVFYNGPTNKFFEEYIINKKEQNDICMNRLDKDSPKVLNILPGLVDTEMSSIFSAPKIRCEDLADYVYDIIKYRNIVSTQQIIVDVPSLNWKDVKVNI